MRERQLTRLELLREVSQALNMIPRKGYRGGKYRDTYELAAELDRHLAWEENNKAESDA
ncbi:hypothetical protein [Bradyrhizobium sp. DASA03007]|uniref:hypothetical protein n=1 Tax=unclassified Bradyrhizobium TaxID=2631580 RepID=UPI003F6E8C79